MIFSRKPTPEQLRTAIEDIVNPQVFALRKEIKSAQDLWNDLLAGTNYQPMFSKLSHLLYSHCKALNDIEVLNNRISKLETAAITPVTSRKAKKPKRRVRARGKAK